MRLLAKGSLNTTAQDMPHAVAQPQHRRRWSGVSLHRSSLSSNRFSGLSSKWSWIHYQLGRYQEIHYHFYGDLFYFVLICCFLLMFCRPLWMISSRTMQRSLRETLLEYMQVRGSDWCKGWMVFACLQCKQKKRAMFRDFVKFVWSQAMNK